MSSLVVDAVNSTAFDVTWMSPEPSIKNGIVKCYFVNVHLHSSRAKVKSMRFSVNEPFSDIKKYTATITGLGMCENDEV